MQNPYITSRVNGMQIPLLKGQVGIMHRFAHPENKLVIESIHENGTPAGKEPERMTIAASTESEVASSPARAPRSAASAVKPTELTI